MAKKSAIRVTSSTGNVFRDLGFSKEESEHLLIRADLLIQVQKAIVSKRLKQAEAAKILRVTQPRVSDLLRGRRRIEARRPAELFRVGKPRPSRCRSRFCRRRNPRPHHLIASR